MCHCSLAKLGNWGFSKQRNNVTSPIVPTSSTKWGLRTLGLWIRSMEPAPWRKRGPILEKMKRLVISLLIWNQRKTAHKRRFKKLLPGGTKPSLKNFTRGKSGKISDCNCRGTSKPCPPTISPILRTYRKQKTLKVSDEGVSRSPWKKSKLLRPWPASRPERALIAYNLLGRGWRWSREMRGRLVLANLIKNRAER